MTAAVLSLSTNTADFSKTIFAKVNRWFMLIGYSRAMAEMVRLGYYKEAENLMKDFKAL